MLVNFRWVSIGGQSLVIAVAYFAFGKPVPIVECGLIIVLTALLNIVFAVSLAARRDTNSTDAAVQLCLDVMQLSSMLYLTGGLSNPFAVLFLAPVTVAASIVTRYETIVIGLLSLVCLVTVGSYHLPLPWTPTDYGTVNLPPLYLIALGGALAASLVFIGYYTRRAAEEAQRVRHALGAAELALERESKFATLNELAAAAVHDLATPLATIALVARDLQDRHGGNGDLADDLSVLLSESTRCRDMLRRLARDATEASRDNEPIPVVLKSVIASCRRPGIEVRADCRPLPGGSEEDQRVPAFARTVGLPHALRNLVDNAFDFAATSVSIDVRWGKDSVTIDIADDGPGIAPEIAGRLGEALETSRAGNGDEKHGHGLGFFIAKTLIERSGGTIAFSNAVPPASGARVHLRWPRGAEGLNDAKYCKSNSI